MLYSSRPTFHVDMGIKIVLELLALNWKKTNRLERFGFLSWLSSKEADFSLHALMNFFLTFYQVKLILGDDDG